MHTAWKDVQLPALTDWEGIEHYSFSPDGAILITATAGQTITVDFSPVRPGTETRVKAVLIVAPAAGTTAGLSFSDKTVVFHAGTNQIDLISTLPLDPILSITGVTELQIISLQLQIRFPDRSNPLPYDLIGFDVLTPNVAPGFIIGKSRIGQAPLGGQPSLSPGFIIGSSRLDQDSLPISLPEYTWKDILGPGLSLTFRQGANGGSSLLPVAQVGTAAIEIRDFDPRAAYLRVGLKCRIYHRLTREILYTGTLASFTLTPGKGKGEHDVATLEFVDTVGILANTKRYGVRSAEPETLSTRITRLLKDTGLSWRILDGTPPVQDLLGSTVSEDNLAAYLDATVATIGGAWWVDPDGTITINPNNEVTLFRQVPWFIIGETPLDGGKLPPDDAVRVKDSSKEPEQVENPFIIGSSRLGEANVASAMISEGFIIGSSRLDHGTLADYQGNTVWALNPALTVPLFTDSKSEDSRALYYTDINPSFNSAEMLTEVAVENLTAVKENGDWRDATKTLTARNPDAAIVFGLQRKTIRAYAASDAQAQALADYLLSRPLATGLSAFKISSLVMNALKESETITKLGLFDYCQVVYRGSESQQLIYAFENQLTPYTWRQRIYLTEAKERTVKV